MSDTVPEGVRWSTMCDSQHASGALKLCAERPWTAASLLGAVDSTAFAEIVGAVEVAPLVTLLRLCLVLAGG